MTKNLTFICISAFIMSLITLTDASAQIISSTPRKKLIDFGWYSPYTAQFRDSLQNYEKKPFDGLTIKLPKNVGGGNIFMVKDLLKISKSDMETERGLIKRMPQSKILTDNFIVIYGGSQMDWFSDDEWAVADTYIRYVAQLAKAMKCKGVLWDPEPYKPGKNPWKYDEQSRADKFTYEDYYVQIRKRGVQFIKALQEEFPGLIVFSLREFSDYQKGSPFSAGLLPVDDISKTKEELKTGWWGLHLPFTIGILDAIDADVRLIDANEDAYYYTSALEFFQIRNILKNDGRALVPADLHNKFASNYSIGHAISADYVAGNWAEGISFPFRLKGQAKMLTPVEQALWFEHNAYYALRTSDEYSWLYTEKANWWTGRNVPDGFAEALIKAKKKVDNGEELGFSVDEMLAKARQRAEKIQPEKKK